MLPRMSPVTSRLARILVLISLASAVAAALAVPTSAPAAGRVTGGAIVKRDAYDARWRSIVSLSAGADPDFEALARKYDKDAEKYLNAQRVHRCGGTLVSPSFVVTAAHCVEDFSSISTGTLHYRVRVGARVLLKRFKGQPGELVDVDSVRIHPSWTGTSNFSRERVGVTPVFDVAVLHLATPVTDVEPMRLVGAGEQSLWGGGAGLASGARVAGWGLTSQIQSWESSQSTPQELSDVDHPLLADAACERTDGPMGADSEYYDRRSMLCAYGRDTLRPVAKSNRRGACYGDSGGPLAVTGADGAPRLVGVVSWGPTTGGGCNRPSIYTRIDAVRPWIEQVISGSGQSTTVPVPSVTGITQTGVNTARVTWTTPSGGVQRVRLLRDLSMYELFHLRPYEYLDDEADSDDEEDEDEGEEIDPRLAAAYGRLRFTIPVGSTGPEGTSLLVRDLAPRTARSNARMAFRVEVRDADGRPTIGPRVFVDRVADTRAPTRPGRPRVAKRAGNVPIIRWIPSKDDDCVLSYRVQVRQSASARWRTFDLLDGRCGEGVGMTSSYDWRFGGSGIFSIGEDWQYSGGGSSELPILGLRAGTWQVRIIAKDRVGHLTAGPVGLVRVDHYVKPFEEDYDCTTIGIVERCWETTLDADGPDEDDEDY